jgi:L-ascorbate metabolism protein UlaG (beta-lactamase superfamily)
MRGTAPCKVLSSFCNAQNNAGGRSTEGKKGSYKARENKENKQVKCDIALVPIGGTYTMDAKKAAELINTIRPAVAIPTHYGSVVGSMDAADVFSSHVKAPVKVEIKLQY